jgi:hypothetical protein
MIADYPMNGSNLVMMKMEILLQFPLKVFVEMMMAHLNGELYL